MATEIHVEARPGYSVINFCSVIDFRRRQNVLVGISVTHLNAAYMSLFYHVIYV